MNRTKKAIAMMGAVCALFLALQGPVHADYGFTPSEKSGYGLTQADRSDYGFVRVSEPSKVTHNEILPAQGTTTTINTPLYQYPSYGYRDPGTYCRCPVHNNQPYRYYGYCPNNHGNGSCTTWHHCTNHNATKASQQRPSTVIGVNGLLPNR
jgi:hypothetical protein